MSEGIEMLPQTGVSESTNSSVFVKGNHLYFYASVRKNTVAELVELIRSESDKNIYIAISNNTKPLPLYLHINSGGGSLFDGLAAADAIRTCAVPIYTVIDGAAASAATIMSVCGTKRFINENAYMLIHQLSSGFWGKYSEFKDNKKNLDRLMDTIRSIYRKYTNLSEKKMKKLLNKDLWLPSDDCIKLGLADELYVPKKLY